MLKRLKEILYLSNPRRASPFQSNEFWQAIFRAVDRLWSPPLPQKVLAISCRSILFLLWLDKRGHLPHGVDPSGDLFLMARSRLPGRIPLWHAKPEKLPFDSSSFDVVFLALSLEYASDPEKALREAFRVAKSSVIIVSLNAFSPYLWFMKLSGWAIKNPFANCRIIAPGLLTNMSRLIAGVPIRISYEAVQWKNMGTTLFSPIVVTRFDFAHQVKGIFEIPLTSSRSQQFIPSPSSYEKFRLIK
ncbi:MAG: class I SAM-dependent methyltransferase [Syntrophobacterales bacterium]|nr:class I SAM-dependent methyltransferase [Syntrophobacterales bacterium]